MLIEYKIKFEKDGVTVTQRMEPNASNRPAVSNVAGKPTFSKIVGDKVGDGLAEDPERVGGGVPGSDSGRIIAFGPVIFCGSDGTGVVLPAKDVPGADKDKDAEKAKPAPPPATASAATSH
jgi:hypothetical protein